MEFKPITLQEITNSTSYKTTITILNIEEEFTLNTIIGLLIPKLNKYVDDKSLHELKTYVYNKLETMMCLGQVSQIDNGNYYIVNKHVLD